MGEGTMGPNFALKDGQKGWNGTFLSKNVGILKSSHPSTGHLSQVRQYRKQSFTLKNLAKEQTT